MNAYLESVLDQVRNAGGINLIPSRNEVPRRPQTVRALELYHRADCREAFGLFDIVRQDEGPRVTVRPRRDPRAISKLRGRA